MPALSPAEQGLLDKAKATLQQLAIDERANSASGRLGVIISIRNGILEVQSKPRRFLDAGKP